MGINVPLEKLEADFAGLDNFDYAGVDDTNESELLDSSDEIDIVIDDIVEVDDARSNMEDGKNSESSRNASIVIEGTRNDASSEGHVRNKRTRRKRGSKIHIENRGK